MYIFNPTIHWNGVGVRVDIFLFGPNLCWECCSVVPLFRPCFGKKTALVPSTKYIHPRHAFAHLVLGLRSSNENVRNHKTLAEEDMLGKLTTLASSCPGSNVLQRFYQRFNLFLAMHWERIIEDASTPQVVC